MLCKFFMTDDLAKNVNNSHCCFSVILGENAVIEYKWIEDSVVDLYHTYVPPSHRGRGVAQLLAKVNFSPHLILATQYVCCTNHTHYSVLLIHCFKKSLIVAYTAPRCD